MSIPRRHEAAALLLTLQPSAWLVRHSAAVAEVASYLAQRCLERGARLDLALVESAALLHDLDKALPKDHRLLEHGHGQAGAAWLAEQGHGELSGAVAGHPARLLSDEQHYPRWAANATLEERIVAYADKRAEQDLVSLAQRFRTWRERHADRAEGLATGLERARRLESEICAAAGIAPEQVARSAWVDQALAAAAGR